MMKSVASAISDDGRILTLDFFGPWDQIWLYLFKVDGLSILAVSNAIQVG